MRHILNDIPIHTSKELDSDIFPYICHFGLWFSSVHLNKSLDIKPTRGRIPEDGILHSHRRENLKSYMSKDSPRFLV
jgi:hypothetical protein